MNKTNKTIGAALVIALVLLATSGCTKEGPAERAGKAVDNAATHVGQQVEKAGETVKDAAQGSKR